MIKLYVLCSWSGEDTFQMNCQAPAIGLPQFTGHWDNQVKFRVMRISRTWIPGMMWKTMLRKLWYISSIQAYELFLHNMMHNQNEIFKLSQFLAISTSHIMAAFCSCSKFQPRVSCSYEERNTLWTSISDHWYKKHEISKNNKIAEGYFVNLVQLFSASPFNCSLIGDQYMYKALPPLPAQHNLTPPPTLYPQKPMSTPDNYNIPRFALTGYQEISGSRSKRTDINVWRSQYLFSWLNISLRHTVYWHNVFSEMNLHSFFWAPSRLSG